MESLKINEIVNCLKGRAKNITKDFEINGVSTDSRNIKKGELFIALIGDSFDGHNFIHEVFKRGAAVAVVSRDIECDYPIIVVNDTLDGLKKIASCYKQKFHIPVIAVTGSTGKTSTKEMIAALLQEKFNVHKTQQNFNNEIGLPHTLFNLNKNHEISVLEMGMNNPGEIQRLADMARPDVCVITNIGTAHIENLGSRENILKAKMEITTYFTSNNVLIINSDDEYLSKINNESYKILRVSINGNGDYNAVNINNLGEYGIEFTVELRGYKHLFKIDLPGIHNVYNALYAIAIGDIYDVDVEQMKAGILKFNPGKMRMDIIELKDGVKIINDCYNANPDSMKAALDVLSAYKNNRKIAILGDMYELGSYSEEAHRNTGEYAQDKCDILIAVGDQAVSIYEEGKKHIESYYFKTREEACLNIKCLVKPKDVILIKASRRMNMEYITNFIVEDRKER
ncbi:MAG: UDP-N-acetylmuramoylalanyl-D-glutamyl-2,6-diaminopimelate/D-alanyl-D-alanyl ligase [Clostridiales bacterium]|jgi:UDP-N-acetylmuramoyl-tripeptide--D-alanyl-D-alanine ligase|nr:UDP-N-acetylmuramoylalanyl-D-glutamyl-2,6-diaminopimelate/D-alanyl-D-alanyl ligase [Clostridiales bacterium]